MEIKYFALVIFLAITVVIAFSGCLESKVDNTNSSVQAPAVNNTLNNSVTEDSLETSEVDEKVDSVLINESDDVTIGEMN